MVAEGFAVDLSKPQVFQVGHLEEAYEEWVHRPIPSKKGPRLFNNDLMEALTRTRWWVVPLLWLPVACWFISKAAANIAPTQVVLMAVIGVLTWTWVEYVLHRFLFHIKTKTYWGNTVHYLLHGCHHKHPMDGPRLVFPPAATAVLCFPMYGFVRLFSTPATAPAVFAGGLLGYVLYDITHYYLHHGHPTNQVLKDLKKYHLNHHFGVSDAGFGITSPFWDKVFGTLPPPKATQKNA